MKQVSAVDDEIVTSGFLARNGLSGWDCICEIWILVERK